MPPPATKPKNYFLNESHELSAVEKSGGGKQLPILNVDWSQKGQQLRSSLQRVSQRASHSSDPLAQRRYYLIADRTKEIVKASKAEDAIHGQKVEAVVFSGEQ